MGKDITLVSQIDKNVRKVLEYKQDIQAIPSLNSKYQARTPFITITSNAVKEDEINVKNEFREIKKELIKKMQEQFNVSSALNLNIDINTNCITNHNRERLFNKSNNNTLTNVANNFLVVQHKNDLGKEVILSDIFKDKTKTISDSMILTDFSKVFEYDNSSMKIESCEVVVEKISEQPPPTNQTPPAKPPTTNPDAIHGLDKKSKLSKYASGNQAHYNIITVINKINEIRNITDNNTKIETTIEFIAKNESGKAEYNAMNQGTPFTGTGIFNSGNSSDSKRLGRNLTEFTVQEILDKQYFLSTLKNDDITKLTASNKEYRDNLMSKDNKLREKTRKDNMVIFAAGKYQFIPDTLISAVAGGNIDKTSKFDKETQDKIFMYYLKSKLKHAYNYMFDTNLKISNDFVYKALINLSNEYASFPDPNKAKIVPTPHVKSENEKEDVANLIKERNEPPPEDSSTPESNLPSPPPASAPTSEPAKLYVGYQAFMDALSNSINGDKLTYQPIINDILGNNLNSRLYIFNYINYENDNTSTVVNNTFILYKINVIKDELDDQSKNSLISSFLRKKPEIPEIGAKNTNVSANKKITYYIAIPTTELYKLELTYTTDQAVSNTIPVLRVLSDIINKKASFSTSDLNGKSDGFKAIWNNFKLPISVVYEDMAKNYILESVAISSGSKYDGGIFTFEKDGSMSPDKANTPPSSYTGGLGYKPKAGIVSISIDTKGKLGVLRKAVVNLKAFTLEQLQIIQNLYMRPGVYLLVEWGWSIYPHVLDNTNLSDFTLKSNVYKIDFFKNATTSRELLENINTNIIKSNYHYDCLYGVISNFNWSMNELGEFDITINLISQGSSLLLFDFNSDSSNYLNNDFKVYLFNSFTKLFDTTSPENTNYAKLLTKINTIDFNTFSTSMLPPIKKFSVINFNDEEMLKNFKIDIINSKSTPKYYKKMVFPINLESSLPKVVTVNYKNSSNEDATSYISIDSNSFSNKQFYTKAPFENLFKSDMVKKKELIDINFYFPDLHAAKGDATYDYWKYEKIFDRYVDEQGFGSNGIYSSVIFSDAKFQYIEITDWKGIFDPKFKIEGSEEKISLFTAITVYNPTTTLTYPKIIYNGKTFDSIVYKNLFYDGVKKVFLDTYTQAFTWDVLPKGEFFKLNSNSTTYISVTVSRAFAASEEMYYDLNKHLYATKKLNFYLENAVSIINWDTDAKYLKYGPNPFTVNAVTEEAKKQIKLATDRIKYGGDTPYYINLACLFYLLNDTLIHIDKSNVTVESVRSRYTKEISEYAKQLGDIDTNIKADNIRIFENKLINNEIRLKNSFFSGLDYDKTIKTKRVTDFTSIIPRDIIFFTKNMLNVFKEAETPAQEKFRSANPNTWETQFKQYAASIVLDFDETETTSHIGGNLFESTYISAACIMRAIDASSTLDSFLKEICSKIYNASSYFLDLVYTPYTREDKSDTITFYEKNSLDYVELKGDIFKFKVLSNKSILKNLSFSSKLPTSFQRVAFASSAGSSNNSGSEIVNEIFSQFSNGYINNSKKINFLPPQEEDTTPTETVETNKQNNPAIKNLILSSPFDGAYESFTTTEFINYYSKDLNDRYRESAYGPPTDTPTGTSTGTSTGTPTFDKKPYVIPPVGLELSFTIDGISGIKWGDLLSIDYLPIGLQNAKFQVIGVTDEIVDEVWSTKIQTILRAM